MAKKYWWEEDENQTSTQNQTKVQEETEKKYWWDEVEDKNERQGYWWDKNNIANDVGSNVTNQVNNWLKGYNSYISDYQKRYSGRKGTYEDAYVSDSADWLDKVTQRKSKLDTDADAIMSYLDQYKDYLDEEWVSKVKTSLRKAKSNANNVIQGATKDHEYWSSFGSDEELLGKYGSAQGVYEYYQREGGYHSKYNGLSADDLQWATGFLEDGEEKEWLTSYAASVDYNEKSKYDLAAGEAEIAALEQEILDLDDYFGKAQDILLDYTGNPAEYDKKAAELYKNYGGTAAGVISYAEKKKKEIEEKKKYLNEAKKIQELNAWSSVTENSDFAQNSKYVSNVEYELFGKPTFTDDTYAYVNNPTVEDKRPLGAGEATARELIKWNDNVYKSDTPLRNNESSYEKDALEYMKEDEIAIYNYYYATQGPEKARQYLDLLVATFKARKDAATYANTAEFSNEHPWIASALSVGTSIGSGFEYIGDVIDYGADKLFGKDAQMDTNSLALQTNAIRGTVSDKVDWEIGNWDAFDFLYSTTMSGLDSLTSTAFGGAGGVVLGLSAAAQGTNDALTRGMSSDQAFWNGLFTGAFEMVFESVSIGNFNRLKEVPPKTVKDIFKNLGKSMLVNASEETLTEIANIAYDTLINGEFANYTLEELSNGAWKQALNQVVEAGASGALMGVGMGAAAQTSGYVQNKKANNAAVKQYGGKTDILIQEGLESDVKSESYKLAQEYKKQTDEGKALSGEQIRNLLSANNEQVTPKVRQVIKQLAVDRLTELGQTEDVSKVAELATKYATGQKLSNLEKSVLARSQYGAQVAKEMTTRAYDEATKTESATYKPLTERAKTAYVKSETGKATINGEAVSMDDVTVASIGKDGMTLRVDGEEVSVNDIEFADDSQSYLYAAVSKIENITPGAATAIIRGYDSSSGQTVGEYLNGVDEAYTYGYHGYSEADLKAGQFTAKLTDKQVKEAYKMGQYVKEQRGANKADVIKQMRTAVEAETEKAKAEGKEAPSPKKMTITYNEGNGKVVDFEKASVRGRLTTKQKAAPALAQVMHEMGLGTNFELFSSYVNKDGVRVFLDENGVERKAYSGVYRKSDGTIRIDLNAYNGKKLTLDAMSHELTHFIQQWSAEKYEVLADFLVKTYEKTDMTMHERVLREQARLKGVRGKEVSYSEAYDEVVANAMSKMLSDSKVMEKLTELQTKDADLAHKLWQGLKKLLNKFFRIYEKESALFYDAADLMEMKAEFEQMKQMWAEAFVEASENFQANLMTTEVGVEPVAVEDISQYSYSSLAEAAGFEAVENEDGTRSFTRDGKKVSKVTVEDIENSPIGAFINFSLEMGDINDADATRQKQIFADICTMACTTNDFAMTMQFVGSAVFTGMKANADKQYGTTYDFPSICTKTQAVIDAMSAKMVKLGRGLKTDEIVQLYDDVFASGNPVPCPECYVFSRWIGIGGLLDNIKKYQDYYGDMDVKEVASAYLKMKAEVSKFADEQGISFGKAKESLTSKLTKEFNKLNEKIEKAQNQGEKVKPADIKRLSELEPMMNTVKSMTWLENVYFADSSLKKVNPNFRVPDSVLFDLNNGEAFATKYKEAWAFRTTQGAGYGKAITPYDEARLGEGVLVTNNTTNAIKGKAQGSLNNYFLSQMGKLDKQSRDALKRARLKQKIQAFIGGQRFQSTSDARYENASDYLLAALELQAMGGMVQCYTKVDGAVPAFSAWGFSINQSLMPLNGGLDADGNVKDTAVGGMKPSVAFENRNKHESAGTITIGVNDNHIRAMFKQWVRDFIIPYHASGGKADVVAEFRRIQEGKEAKGKAVRSTDYSRTQSDKVLSDEVLRWQGKTDAQIQRIHEIRDARIAILTGGKVNMTVVRSNRFLSALYDKLNGGEWDGVKLAKSKVESQIFPNEFWDQTVSYEESGKITKDYLEYCEDLGFLHRFSGMVPSNGKLVPVNGCNENGERVQLTDLAYQYDENGNKTDKVEDFFWKVLTDRRMYDNNGNYLAQKVVTLNDTTTETVTGFAKNNQGREYDKAKAEALAQKIVAEQYSSQETDIDNFDIADYPSIKLSGAEQRRLEKEAMTWNANKVGRVLYQTLTNNYTYVYYFDTEHNITVINKFKATNIHERHGVVDDKQNRRKIDRNNGRSGSERRTDSPALFGTDRGTASSSNQTPGKAQSETRTSNRGGYAEGTSDADKAGVKEQYSSQETDLDNAPTFYSQMGKVVESMKQEKFGASSVISMLRGRGVKAEEIRWSGIQAFLDGKKSVTKTELLDFIKGSMLQIDEETRSGTGEAIEEFVSEWQRLMDYDLPRTQDMEIDDAFVEDAKAYLDSSVEDEDISQEDMDYLMDLLLKAKDEGKASKWHEYKLDGGKNYRELVFRMPGSDYSNTAMQAHWGEKGVLAHARIQDFNTFIGKMLFIEEIQSDWHNAGAKHGYFSESDKATKNNTEVRHENGWYNLYRDGKDLHQGVSETFLKQRFTNGITEEEIHEGLVDEYNRAVEHSGKGWKAPDAPFKGNYHEYVLKRLLRMAAEQGYDSIGWTTADIQSNRWSEDYSEGYRIEYDQEIPKFLKKYGKQWDTTVGKTVLDNGTEVWSMAITDSMKESVLEEGQAMYSGHETDNVSNRSLLANAFEGIVQNSKEYELIQEYKGRVKILNEYEAKLDKLNAEIREIRFGTTGPRDMARLQQLETEAKNVAKDINRNDKKLLSLEASEPLRKVIERERKKEAQKTVEHVEEIQQNKKVRAEQTELRHKIRKAVRDLDKLLNRGNKKQNVKEDIQSVVSTALKAADILFTDNYSTYDMLRNGIGTDLSDAEESLVATCTRMLKDLDKMPTDGYENWQARQEAENRLRTKMSKLNEVFARERKRLNSTTVSSILGELADAYAKLDESELSYVQGAYSEPVHNFLKNLQSEVGGTIVNDMTKDQLESVYAAYKMVLTTVRKANQMFNEELKLSREQLGNAVIEEVIKAGGVHLLGTPIASKISQFDWNNTKPIWVANRIGSDTFGKLMNGLFKGQYNFAVDIAETKQFKLDMDKKYRPREWNAEKLYEFESSTGKKFSLNLQQIMSLYAFSKREQAYSHLLNGGFAFEKNTTVVVDGKLGIKKTYIHKGATSYKLNEATLNGIINSLTVEQKAYVDEMQKYLSEVMGAKGNEVSMQLYGIQMFKEKFYFPLRSSGDYMEKAKAAELKKEQGQINLANSGFTHSVKPEAKNPIILSGFMDVWAEHCNEMSMYHSMVLPMEDFRKVYNYSTVHDDKFDSASVQQTIIDAYGEEATKYIDQLYSELNAGATVDPRETPYKKLISNFKKAAVMLSGSVFVQQFSSIGRAYAVIDPKYFAGTKVNSDTKLSAVEEMKKYAPVAIIKEMGGFDTGTKGSAKSYIMAESYGKGERIKGLLKDEQYRGDVMGFLPAWADQKTWCAIWEATKRETKAKNPQMDVKSDEFLKLAGDRFSEVIEKTQVYDSVLARSANMRSKGNFMAMATAFMAEPTTTVNLLEDAIRSGNAKHIARAFGSVAVSIVLNNALASIVYAMRDDDEDETFIEKYFQAFTSGMMDDINPMSYYPFLKDIYSMFQGYDVERTDMSVIGDVRDSMKQVLKYLTEDTSEMDDDEIAEHNKNLWGAFGSLLDAGCSMFGVPVKNVRRDVNGLINAFSTIGKDLSGERNTTWLSFWDKVGAAVKDTIPVYALVAKDESKTDKLYRVITNGDKSYLARLKSTYKTDDAYNSAVRKALRENDPRIREAAQAYYDGNVEEYKRLVREIRNDDKWNLIGYDNTMAAIDTELSKLTPDKVTSEHSARDFVDAVIVGNTSSAQTIREDIIATHMENGKTQEEAEEAFASAVSTSTKEAYSAGLLSVAGAENLLVDYADMDEEDATSRVDYWAFCNKNPKYAKDISEDKYNKYKEFAEPAKISLDVFVQYIKGTKGLETKYDKWGEVEVSEREQVLEVIDSLPLTWQQKDALYLAHRYAESKIWDVPW